MRINRYIALATGLSRRAADKALIEGRIAINGRAAAPGAEVSATDEITLDGRLVQRPVEHTTILLHKPAGYVVSRSGQGAKTVYTLLPPKYHSLKPVGRLDKDSSGLLLMTDDGKLANELTHPSFQKEKVYEVALDKPLTKTGKKAIEQGIKLEDGISALTISGSGKQWVVSMKEGRNRQIRRTFAALGYTVTRLHRTRFGKYGLDKLTEAKYLILS